MPEKNKSDAYVPEKSKSDMTKKSRSDAYIMLDAHTFRVMCQWDGCEHITNQKFTDKETCFAVTGAWESNKGIYCAKCANAAGYSRTQEQRQQWEKQPPGSGAAGSAGRMPQAAGGAGEVASAIALGLRTGLVSLEGALKQHISEEMTEITVKEISGLEKLESALKETQEKVEHLVYKLKRRDLISWSSGEGPEWSQAARLSPFAPREAPPGLEPEWSQAADLSPFASREAPQGLELEVPPNWRHGPQGAVMMSISSSPTASQDGGVVLEQQSVVMLPGQEQQNGVGDASGEQGGMVQGQVCVCDF